MFSEEMIEPGDGFTATGGLSGSLVNDSSTSVRQSPAYNGADL
jgi:hypothetical protein